MAQGKRIGLGLILLPFTVYGSFIESTMGTAVVNDATATFHNPAALTLLKKAQVVGLSSEGIHHDKFLGNSIEKGGLIQAGISRDQLRYNLPSGYLTVPLEKNLKLGLAVLSDNLDSDLDENSILRYNQSSNQIKNIDAILGAAFELNQVLSIGGGVIYSDARFNTHKIIGFPHLDLPDSQSNNQTKSHSAGWNVGFLIKPWRSTKLGFDYRSVVAYQFKGSSEFEGPPLLISNQFGFNFWTPARSVLTFSQFLTKTLNVFITGQRVQWSVFKSVRMQGLAAPIANQAGIIPQVYIPYHLRDIWILTLGGIKKLSPKWILRVAATYDQSAGNGFYNIINGDAYVLGASAGYQLTKKLAIDGSYAHAFIKNQSINISSQARTILGLNQGSHDAVALKLTWTI